MWKTSTLQQFLKLTYIFMLILKKHVCNCDQQYCFTSKSNHKNIVQKAEQTFSHKRLLDITSWSHNLCCFTNYWVGFFCSLVVVIFLSFNLCVRSITLFYYCVLTGLNFKWTKCLISTHFSPLLMILSPNAFYLSCVPGLSLCLITCIQSLIFEWTGEDKAFLAEETCLGETAKWTVKFSCVLSLSLVQQTRFW